MTNEELQAIQQEHALIEDILRASGGQYPYDERVRKMHANRGALLVEVEWLRAAVAEEREACAKVVESHTCKQPPEHVCEEVIAATIRARSG